MSTKGISACLWAEDPAPGSKTGDGISRPLPKARTRPITLLLTGGTVGRMKVTMQAESVKHAKQYATARWPGVKAEVVK